MPEPLTIRVLLVDDDRSFCESLRQFLELQQGEVRFEVEGLTSAIEALNLGEQVRRFDVALIDQALVSEDRPSLNGTELMVQLKKRAEELEVVVVTGWGVQAETGIEAIRRGAYRYFAKGGPIEEIPLLVRAAYERREGRRLARERDHTLAAAEAERQRANEMETLNDIGRIIATVPSLEELPRLIYREAGRVLDTTNFFIAYYDPDTQENDVRLIYRHGVAIQPMRTSVERGLSGWVVRHRQPLLLSHGTYEFRQREGIDMIPEAVSWLGVPIMSGERVLGIVGAQEYEQPGKFDSNHLKVLEVIARFAAAAIENAQAMARLRQEQDRYSRMVASSFDGIIAIDLEGRITEYNAAAERTLGYTRSEMLGESITRLYRDPPIARRINKLLHANPDHRITGERVEVISRSGEAIPLLLSASLLFGAKGQAIGSAGYFEDLRRSQILETRFDDLLEAVKGIASLRDPDRLAKVILSTARKAIPSAVKGSLHLYEPAVNRLIPMALDGYPPEVTETARLAPGDGFAGQTFVTRTPVRISDALRDSRVKRLPDPAFQRGSAICVPLIYQDRVLGTLSLDNPDQVDAFTGDDLHLLEEFADLAAIALVNARQHQRRMEELQAVRTVDGLLGPAPDLDVTLNLIANVAQRQTDSRRADLFTIDRSEAGRSSALTLRASSCRAFDESEIDSEPLAMVEATIAYVLQEGRTAQEELPGGGWRFLAPLKSPNAETAGVLVLVTERADAYDDGAQALASTLAQQAAIALQNEAQFRALLARESQLQRQNQELENARQELETYGVVAAMSMFGAEITHSLAQKAFVLSNLAGMVRELYPHDNRVVELTTRLEEEAWRLSKFPLELAGPTVYPTPPSTVLVDDALRRWVTIWCRNHPNVQLGLDLDCPGIAIQVIPELFKGALRKLVENALRAMAETGGMLSIASRTTPSRVEIVLADTGPGIPQQHRTDFLKRKVDKGPSEVGMGMGALMSRLVFQYHHGDLQLLSTGSQGTTILITLPLADESSQTSGGVQ